MPPVSFAPSERGMDAGGRRGKEGLTEIERRVYESGAVGKLD